MRIAWETEACKPDKSLALNLYSLYVPMNFNPSKLKLNGPLNGPITNQMKSDWNQLQGVISQMALALEHLRGLNTPMGFDSTWLYAMQYLTHHQGAPLEVRGCKVMQQTEAPGQTRNLIASSVCDEIVAPFKSGSKAGIATIWRQTL